MTFSPTIAYRFKKDLNLPLPIHFKEQFFNYFLNIMSKYLFPDVLKEWENMRFMSEEYGNADLMLERYAMIKDAIIEHIKDSEKYEEFNQCKLPTLKNDISSRNIFNDENIGKRFVSIDLRLANFQTLRKYGVIPNREWPEYVEMVALESGCTDKDKMLIDYITKSKYTRQVIFGQCNPKRTIAFEKVYINEVNDLVDNILASHKLISSNSDELIYEMPEEEPYDIERALRIKELVREKLGLEVRISHIYFVGVKLKTENGYTVASGYLNNALGQNFFKCVPEPYMPMFIEWYNATRENELPIHNFDNFSLYSQYIVHDGVICRLDEKMHIELIEKS